MNKVSKVYMSDAMVTSVAVCLFGLYFSTKGMVEVTIDETGVSTQIIPLKPQKDLVKVVGKYEDVLHYPNNENDFVAVELLDKQVIGHAYDFLKEKYQKIFPLVF